MSTNVNILNYIVIHLDYEETELRDPARRDVDSSHSSMVAGRRLFAGTDRELASGPSVTAASGPGRPVFLATSFVEGPLRGARSPPGEWNVRGDSIRCGSNAAPSTNST